MNKTQAIALTALISILVSGALVYAYKHRQVINLQKVIDELQLENDELWEKLQAEPDKSNDSAELPESDFHYDEAIGDYSGTLYVRGYPDMQGRPEAFCEEEDCPVYNYVSFVITEVESEAFDDFAAANTGNAFVNDKRVGLGCENQGLISFTNSSDEYGFKDVILSGMTSEAILSATEEAPVTLKLTRLPLTLGSGAPTCYSHFVEVEVLE